MPQIFQFRYWITFGSGFPYINIVVCVRFKRVRVNVAEPNRAGTKPGQGRVESSSCSRKSADRLAANCSLLKEQLALGEWFVAGLSTLSFN